MVIDVYGWREKEEKCEKERRGKGLVVLSCLSCAARKRGFNLFREINLISFNVLFIYFRSLFIRVSLKKKKKIVHHELLTCGVVQVDFCASCAVCFLEMSFLPTDISFFFYEQLRTTFHILNPFI